MGLREELAQKRLEIALMEADVRIEDLEAEIIKVRDRRAETATKLQEMVL